MAAGIANNQMFFQRRDDVCCYVFQFLFSDIGDAGILSSNYLLATIWRPLFVVIHQRVSLA